MEIALLQVGEKALCGLVADASAGGVRIRQAFTDMLEKPLESIPIQDRGPALLEIFKRNGFDPRRVTLVIPRRFAILRSLRLPTAPMEELPAMVRFQLAKELPIPIERTHFSWRILSENAGETGISTVSVPADVLEPLRTALGSIGIRVSAALLSSDGLAELLADGKTLAIEYAFDHSLELVVRSAGGRTFSQSSSIQGLSEREVTDQLRRMLITHHEQNPDAKVAKLYTTGPREGLEDALPVEPIDLKALLAGDERRPPPEAIALIGAARGLARRSPNFHDLLAPPVPPKRSKTIWMARTAFLFGILLLGVPIYLKIEISDRREEIARHEKEIEKLKGVPKRLEILRNRYERVQSWAADRPRWIDVLADLSDIVDTRVLYVTELTMDLQGNATIVGRARSKQDPSSLVQRLNESPRFDTAMLIIAQENTERRGRPDEHPVSFTIKARVNPREGIR